MKPRIHLEKLKAHDFENFYAMTGNEKVMAMVTGRALSMEEARKKFNYFLQNNELYESFGGFKVLDATGSHIRGFAKLEIREDKRDEAELGYMLLPEFWGQGLGNEIAEYLMIVAKTDPLLKRVWANTDPNNTASRKILLKHGFASSFVGEIDGLSSEIFDIQLHT